MKVMEVLDSDLLGSYPHCASSWQLPWNLSFLDCKMGMNVLRGIATGTGVGGGVGEEQPAPESGPRAKSDPGHPQGSPLTTLPFFPRSPCFLLR